MFIAVVCDPDALTIVTELLRIIHYNLGVIFELENQKLCFEHLNPELGLFFGDRLKEIGQCEVASELFRSKLPLTKVSYYEI